MEIVNHLKKYINRNLLDSLGFIAVLFLLDWGVSTFALKGIEKFYGLKEQTELAFIGHSHLMLGINKEEVEENLNIKVSKYTREGVNVADREIMIRQLVSDNPTVKTVVYGVDAWMFTGEGLSDNSFKLFYPFMDNPVVEDYVQSAASLTDYLQHKLIRSSRFNSLLINAAFRGYLGNWSNLKYGFVDIEMVKNEIDQGNFRKIESQEENKKIFERTLDFLNEHNIKVILVYVPTLDVYNEAEPMKFHTEIEYFQQLSDNKINIDYLDYLEAFSEQHSLFYDKIHLNPKGQENLTKQFIVDYKTLYSKKLTTSSYQ